MQRIVADLLRVRLRVSRGLALGSGLGFRLLVGFGSDCELGLGSGIGLGSLVGLGLGLGLGLADRHCDPVERLHYQHVGIEVNHGVSRSDKGWSSGWSVLVLVLWL